MRNLCFTILCIALGNGLIGQSPSWSSIQVSERTVFQQMEIDTLGFLWVLSHNGLYKYDGYQVGEVLVPDSTQIAFRSLDLDQYANLLIGCDNGTILSFSPYSLDIAAPDLTPLDGAISFINCPDPNTNCLVISYGNHLLWRHTGVDTLLSSADILVSNEVYAGILEENVLYLATDQGLQILEIKDDKLVSRVIGKDDGLSDIIVTNIQKRDNWIWITDFDRSISKLNLNNSNVTNLYFDVPSKINDLLLLENGSVAICRNDGMYFIEKNRLIKKYPLQESQRVINATVDEENNMWLSVPGQGLIKGSLLFQQLDLHINQVQALEYIDDYFWIGNSEGLYIYNSDGQQRQLLNNNITTIALQNNLVWIGTYSNGLFVFDRNTFQALGNFNAWENYSNQSVLYTLPTEDKIYISSLTGVISFRYEQDASANIQLYEPKSYNDILGPGYVYQIIVSEDNLYFATDRQGVKVVNDGGLINYNQFEDGSDIGSVYSMVVDTTGNLWFASTKNGLGFLQNGIVQKGPTNRKPDDQYTALANIPNGDILLIRSGSIDILNPTLNHLMSYDSELGISKEPPFLNTFSLDSNNLWFAHSNKLFLYQPPHEIKIHPETQINTVLVNLSDAKGRHIFNQDENNIQFQFTASWLSSPDKLSYQYQLIGIDEEWRNTVDRSISYPKLNPGTYTFKVRAAENTRFDNEPEDQYTFRINRFFYNTIWFWTLVIIAAMILLYRFSASRKLRQLQQSEIDRKHVESQLLNLKNQLNPHFLFNSFNTLVGLIEEDAERSIIFTEKLTDFYRLVLEHGKNQLVPFEEEVKLIRLYIDVLNERFQDSIEVSLPPKKIQSLIPPLTLQLLVENAIKHNAIRPNTKLAIEITTSDTHISIKNKKYPKPYPAPYSGSGLENIQKRYLLLDASAIIILDAVQTFEVRLPIIPSRTDIHRDSDH